MQRPWSTDKHRVPVTLGVMSRCPDALFCESVFDDVRRREAEKINLSFAYLATYVYPGARNAHHSEPGDSADLILINPKKKTKTGSMHRMQNSA
jgi:hypothetical protein